MVEWAPGRIWRKNGFGSRIRQSVVVVILTKLSTSTKSRKSKEIHYFERSVYKRLRCQVLKACGLYKTRIGLRVSFRIKFSPIDVVSFRYLDVIWNDVLATCVVIVLS